MPADYRGGLIEARIRAAREQGAFDALPGHGKPLAIDDLSALDEEQRLEALLLRSAGEVPLEISLAREIRQCRAALAGTLSHDERQRVEQALRAKLAELTEALEARRLLSRATAR